MLLDHPSMSVFSGIFDPETLKASHEFLVSARRPEICLARFVPSLRILTNRQLRNESTPQTTNTDKM